MRQASTVLHSFRQQLRRRGFDIVHPFPTSVYNERVAAASNPPLAFLEDFGRNSTAAEAPAFLRPPPQPSTCRSTRPLPSTATVGGTSCIDGGDDSLNGMTESAQHAASSTVCESSSSMACVVGCSRAVWPHFERWVGNLPQDEWESMANPFWSFVEESVRHSANMVSASDSASESSASKHLGAAPRSASALECPTLSVQCRFYWSWFTDPTRLVAMQRLANETGLSQLDETSYLCFHPRFGPWHSLQCVVAFDLEYDFANDTTSDITHAELTLENADSDDQYRKISQVNISREEVDTIKQLMAKNLQDAGNSPGWTDWLAVRDAYRLGRQFRYCEDQIRYHYTHDRSVLTSLRVSNTNYALATAQISTVSGDVEANARLHREVMEVAAHAAIDILIFPELSLTGYSLHDAGHLQFDLSLDGVIIQDLHQLATEMGMMVIVGLPLQAAEALAFSKGAIAVQSPSKGAEHVQGSCQSGDEPAVKPFLGAAILGAGDKPVCYSKVHVHESEAPFFGFGTSVVSVDVPRSKQNCFDGGVDAVTAGSLRVGLSICRDLKFKSHTAEIARMGAHIYSCSALVEPCAYDADMVLLSSYANDFGMVVALANYSTGSGGLDSAGRSVILAPGGGIVAEVPGCAEALAVGRRRKGQWTGEIVSLLSKSRSQGRAT